MTPDKANAIPLIDVLKSLNFTPQWIEDGIACYRSPLTPRDTPSFCVDLNANNWWDRERRINGDVVSFVIHYLKANREEHTQYDALRWLKTMGQAPKTEFVTNEMQAQASYQLRTLKPIKHVGLVHYLGKQGIPLPLAKLYLKELHVRDPNSGKRFIALGLRNEEGGFALISPSFTGYTGFQTISFIRGRTPKPQRLHLFATVFDYLSALAYLHATAFQADTIILNSLSCLNEALPYIQGYGYTRLCSWLASDSEGERATAFLRDFSQTQEGLCFKTMNSLYAPYHSVRDWHLNRLGLSSTSVL